MQLTRWYLAGFLISFGVLIWTARTAIGSDFWKKVPPESASSDLAIANLVPFSDPLPIPTHIKTDPAGDEITIHLTPVTAQLQKNLTAPTKLWGYNGMSPGPVIDVERGEHLVVHWQNDLPTTSLLPTAPGSMSTGPIRDSRVVFDGVVPDNGASPMPAMGTKLVPGNLPEVRNITHLHGAAVPEIHPMDRLHNSDCWPDAWNVPGQEQIADYPNLQDARSLWYHDHAFGVTGRNVAAGLYGMYLIHDKFERRLHLPSGAYEIPLLFQAIGLNPDGSIFYTNFISTEFYGNAVAVNGKVLPFLNVEPRKYRFRMLNASNARMLGLSLVDAGNMTSPGPAFYQIGTDAGFLAKTAVLNDPATSDAPLLFLASAERADVIIDFSKYAGRSFVLRNTNAITDHDGETPVAQLMKFNVAAKVTSPDVSSLPMKIREIEKIDPGTADQTRRIELTETDFADGSSLFRMDHRAWSYVKKDAEGSYWDYAIDKKPVLGSTEVWELVNTSPIVHPFHVHLVEFQILDRRPFDVDQYKKKGQLVYTSAASAVDPNEDGWKDVVRSNPGEVTRIAMRFGPYPGYFIYHCHILEHEDMDMMTPFQVVPEQSVVLDPKKRHLVTKF